VLQCVRCSALQCVAARCSALQSVAVLCSFRSHDLLWLEGEVLEIIIDLPFGFPINNIISLVYCSVLQCVAVCFGDLRCITV